MSRPSATLRPGGRRPRAPAHRHFHLQLIDFSREPLALRLQALDCLDALRGGRVESREDVVERLPLLLHPGHSSSSGQRLDPTNTRGDATFLGRHEQADISGIVGRASRRRAPY